MLANNHLRLDILPKFLFPWGGEYYDEISDEQLLWTLCVLFAFIFEEYSIVLYGLLISLCLSEISGERVLFICFDICLFDFCYFL
jgi:hypothetical protein